MADKDKWMQDAVKRSGAFSRKAKEHHMTTHQYAEKEKHAGGTLGKEANLALTFAKERPGHNSTRLDPRGAEIHTIEHPEGEQFLSWKYDRHGRGPLHEALEEGTARTPRNPYIDY